MRYSDQFICRRTAYIIAAVFLFVALAANYYHRSAGAGESASSNSKTYVATAANGEKIPYPTSIATYAFKDGNKTIKVPEGMVYIPAGSFIMGTNKSGGMAGTGGPQPMQS
jgi:hypothetical protein